MMSMSLTMMMIVITLRMIIMVFTLRMIMTVFTLTKLSLMRMMMEIRASLCKHNPPSLGNIRGLTLGWQLAQHNTVKQHCSFNGALVLSLNSSQKACCPKNVTLGSDTETPGTGKVRTLVGNSSELF